MFGYVRINKMDLTFREYENYKGYYCGLCKYLKENHGEISRLGLNYDITFLIVILTAIYKPKTNIFHYSTLFKESIISIFLKEKCAIKLIINVNKIDNNVVYRKLNGFTP